MTAVASPARALRAASAEALSCFHCGLPVPHGAHWKVAIDGAERPMCCVGCQTVAQTIVDNGFIDYYRSRSAMPDPMDRAALVPEELRLYDAPENMARFTAAGEDGLSEAMLSVEGIRCAACVWLIEKRLVRVPGVADARLNVATEHLFVRWDGARCQPSDILAAVREVGYGAYPYDPVRHGERLRKQAKTLFRQAFVAGLSMMQVMMYAYPAYTAAEGTMDAGMAGLLQWASLLLTIPAVCYSALPFFRGAWTSLKARRLGMDVPVALGIGAAFLGSVHATFTGEGDVYYDSVTMFVFLLLCSRYVELVARRKASSALERIQRALPSSATLLAAWPSREASELVPAARLAVGDMVLVRPGEAIPADGLLEEGSTAIDVSLLTGESRPVQKARGDALPGGAVNAAQAIVMRVTRAAGDSTLSALMGLVERAGQGKPQLAQWADRVASWFVAGLLVLALATFIAWQLVDPSRAWAIAIAVLVVSCPCALSLATPSALAAATDRLVRQGVLVVHSHVLETLHRATHVVFDKTGTLTCGRPVVQSMALAAGVTRERALAIAAALEASSAHPLAQGIVDAATASGVRAAALAGGGAVTHVGEGLEGIVDGMRCRIGSHAFVAALAGTPAAGIGNAAADGRTPVWLGTEGRWLARFELADALRDGARAVIAAFRRQGKTVVLLSGDAQAVCSRIGAEAGIAEAVGDCLPEAKLAYVRRLQEQGGVVAMVGDGINDAAVLRAADVSFAMGSGATLAQVHADAVLLSGDIGSVAVAAQVAGKTMRVIRQNLAWATVYNVLAIPAAAFGFLNPWMSSIGMSLSSAVVVANALRLRRVAQRSPQRPEIGHPAASPRPAGAACEGRAGSA